MISSICNSVGNVILLHYGKLEFVKEHGEGLNWHIQHVSRECNVVADSLAKKEIGRVEDLVVFEDDCPRA
ncbi:hypothetical protein V6N13_000737 [Hibiscus sabdariffa]|uniref:RNase H type-1 domain-containing protein n=1 Tax=Hibiscus sabdariffa TaxID=183260 RepID=A0ABR2G6A8_9ROSI